MEKFDQAGKSIHPWLVVSTEGSADYMFIRKANRYLFSGGKRLTTTEDTQVVCMTELCEEVKLENTLTNVNNLAYCLDEIDSL